MIKSDQNGIESNLSNLVSFSELLIKSDQNGIESVVSAVPVATVTL